MKCRSYPWAVWGQIKSNLSNQKSFISGIDDNVPLTHTLHHTGFEVGTVGGRFGTVKKVHYCTGIHGILAEGLIYVGANGDTSIFSLVSYKRKISATPLWFFVQYV